MENHHVKWENSQWIEIFNSYVELPGEIIHSFLLYQHPLYPKYPTAKSLAPFDDPIARQQVTIWKGVSFRQVTREVNKNGKAMSIICVNYSLVGGGNLPL